MVIVSVFVLLGLHILHLNKIGGETYIQLYFLSYVHHPKQWKKQHQINRTY